MYFRILILTLALSGCTHHPKEITSSHFITEYEWREAHKHLRPLPANNLTFDIKQVLQANPVAMISFGSKRRPAVLSVWLKSDDQCENSLSIQVIYSPEKSGEQLHLYWPEIKAPQSNHLAISLLENSLVIQFQGTSKTFPLAYQPTSFSIQ